MVHNRRVIKVFQSETFRKWLTSLKDPRAVQRIHARLDRAEFGNLGDVKPLRDGLMEMRIDYGPGYRVYFIRQGNTLIVLLAGGDKRTQKADVSKAIELAKQWRG